MREENGKKIRRVPSLATMVESNSANAGRPGMGDKRRSSRMFLGNVKDTLVRMQSKMKLGREKSSMKVSRMTTGTFYLHLHLLTNQLSRSILV